MSEPTIVTLADAEACALAAAERIVEILDVAIDDHGEAHWVTTGGSSPAAIYGHLASPPLRGELDWRKVQLWFTDERLVPLDHPLSNAKIADDILLNVAQRSGESGTGGLPGDVVTGRTGGILIPMDQVHPIPVGAAIGGSHDQDWAAARYAEDAPGGRPRPRRRRLAGVRPDPARALDRTATSCRSSRAPPRSTARPGRSAFRPPATSSRTSSGSA